MKLPMRWLILFLSVGIFFPIYAQDKNDIIQQRIEFISEQMESEDIDLTDVFEALNHYFQHPINLNNANEDELRALYLLTDLQISNLCLHLKLFGKLISIYELQSLEYWDLQTIALVRPFVRVDDRLDNVHVSLKEAIRQGKTEWFTRYQRTVEQKAGDKGDADSLSSSNAKYFGNADHYYSRVQFRYRTNFSVGITADKDPGEQFFMGTQPNGFDFYSIHGFFKGGKYVKTVAFGDYQVQIGQGLNLWSGYAFGKTADVINIKRTANPIRPYTSTDETRFLRGAAIDLGLGAFSLMVFGSAKRLDANVMADSLHDGGFYVSSIDYSGLHRTATEIARKDALSERIVGTHFRFSTRSLKVGVAGIYQGYDKYLNKNEWPYNQFDFRGKELFSLSTDYTFLIRNFNFFGEASRSSVNVAWAHVHGVLFSPVASASFSLLYRNYDKKYHSFYSNGFAEGSNTRNEKGLYMGLKLKLNSVCAVDAYADVFLFPWMKYRVDAPSSGYEFLIQPMYKPNKQLEIYARYRQQVKPQNARVQLLPVTPLEDVIQRNYRLHLSYKVNDCISLRSRIEYVTIFRQSSSQEKGVILLQDLAFKLQKLPFDCSFRYTLFDTDSYDTRIYTYENNAVNVFSVPAYYYKGSRAYVLVNYSFLKHFELWVRYGNFLFNDRTLIGSGSETIQGNRKSDITVQLRVHL